MLISPMRTLAIGNGDILKTGKAKNVINKEVIFMPRGDGTGPAGQGPGTGQGQGRCRKDNSDQNRHGPQT
jgi:hypothetical protein